MKPSTREWLKKAEADGEAARSLARRRKVPLHDQVCFFCQQSAEKFLKARMDEAGLFPPKSHDLPTLLKVLLPVEPLWAAMQSALTRLSDYAVEFRYPGHNATAAQARAALLDLRMIRREVRLTFGLKP